MRATPYQLLCQIKGSPSNKTLPVSMSKPGLGLWKLLDFEDCYTFVMRFWLKWAIVTLPFVVCVFIWIGSYRYQAAWNHRTKTGVFSVAGNRGVVHLTRSWVGVNVKSEVVFEPLDESWGEPTHRFLGFGFEWESWPSGSKWVQVPMWFIALLTAIPSFWFYRRQRKRRKIGFPVAPVVTNSTESTPAQTG
jgi:hypothetical protein